MKDNVIKFEIEDISGLKEIVPDIFKFADDRKVWALEGVLGAGKTTLIKELARYKNVDEEVTSPSFALINEYRGRDNEMIFHFDFYRIDDEEEAWDIGTEEYLGSGNYCWIEWPSKIPDLLPSNYLHILIEVTSELNRSITVTRNE